MIRAMMMLSMMVIMGTATRMLLCVYCVLVSIR